MQPTDARLACDWCGTTEPVADKLGWLVLGFSSAPNWRRTFCGNVCLNTWSNATLERLTRAVLGEERPT